MILGGRSVQSVGLILLTMLLVVAALVGPRGVRTIDFMTALWNGGVHDWPARVLFQLRLPRVIVAATTGAALSVAGAALQTWLRNPIADSGVLGVSAWGALGAVLVFYTGASRVTWAQPLVASLTALVALLILFALVRRQVPPERLLLLGVGIGALGSALVTLVLCLSLPDWKASRQIVTWLLGGLEGRSWTQAVFAMIQASLGFVLLASVHQDLDALRLGPLEAASLGVDVPRVERRLLFATGLLAGAAVAGAGAIGFVGIIVPSLVRSFGAHHRVWLASAGIYGAGFLVLADLVSRSIPSPSEIQLGVITGLLGAPLLLRQTFATREVHP